MRQDLTHSQDVALTPERYARTIANWASDVLRLRAAGMDRPSWRAGRSGMWAVVGTSGEATGLAVEPVRPVWRASESDRCAA